jgi:hypothetical protein
VREIKFEEWVLECVRVMRIVHRFMFGVVTRGGVLWMRVSRFFIFF